MKLNEIQNKIDEIDEKIVSLIAERAKLSVEDGRAKRRARLPDVGVIDSIRILNRLVRTNKGTVRSEIVEAVFRPILEESRRLQRECCEADANSRESAVIR